MALELFSRILAVTLAIAFTLVLTRGRLPVIPPGIWTFLALFAAGFAMCTMAGNRDGLGTSAVAPGWLALIGAGLGVASMFLLAAVVIGVSWRLCVALLGIAVWGSWLAALVYAISADSPTAPLGIGTVAAILVSVALVAWPTVARRTPALQTQG